MDLPKLKLKSNNQEHKKKKKKKKKMFLKVINIMILLCITTVDNQVIKRNDASNCNDYNKIYGPSLLATKSLIKSMNKKILPESRIKNQVQKSFCECYQIQLLPNTSISNTDILTILKKTKRIADTPLKTEIKNYIGSLIKTQKDLDYCMRKGRYTTEGRLIKKLSYEIVEQKNECCNNPFAKRLHLLTLVSSKSLEDIKEYILWN